MFFVMATGRSAVAAGRLRSKAGCESNDVSVYDH
jgi:hypothetical protein